jgi:hypothetical protein
MAKSLLFLIFLLLAYVVYAQPQTDSVTYTLFFVGDAGEPFIIDDPVGDALRARVKNSGSNTTVVFLGDNIYPKGMPGSHEKGRTIAEKIIQAQVDWIKDLDAEGVFIPGNHDWLRGRKRGWEYLTNQQRWFDSLNNKNITLWPKDGCPGPIEIPLNDQTTLVILDTQWFLHPWSKPAEESECDAKTPADVLILLEDIFTRNPTKRIVVAAHHPLITYGEHGGTSILKDHIFPLTSVRPKLYIPLPILGSFYPLYRKWLGDIQDTSHPLYQEMIKGLGNALAEHPGSIYVSGHEHSLQSIVKDSTYFIVSGSGAKTTNVKKKKYSRFAASVTGFVKAEIFKSGRVKLEYFQVDVDFPNGKTIFTDSLPSQPNLQPPISPVENLDFSDKIVRVKASDQYEAGNGKKKIFGENYRAAWAQEIDVPVFDLGKEQGGLKILQKGGGQQTLSLRMEDSSGREFVIRSIEKFPEKAVPQMFRKTFIQDLVQDQISSAHPYAAVVVPPLAEAAGIYHTNPSLVYVPDDPRLGIYRKDFANTLALFEERPAGDWSDKAYFGNSENIINTTKVLEKLAKDNDNRVDETFVLKSRLFDLWIGDWDRHDDQWRWASFKNKNGETYRPVPRDRDQTFFVNEGIIPKFWSRRWALPKFEGFAEDIRWPSGLSFNARYFDRSFLTSLPEEEWIKIAKDLQNRLTDEVIEKSIKEWPEEIYKLHGDEVIRKLKARRSNLVTYAQSHYKFLARDVDIVGSNKQEQVEVNRLPNGDVQVRMLKLDKGGTPGKNFYNRLFKFSETKSIRIYGLGGDDKFILTGTSPKSILVRVIGGDGNDLLKDDSHVRGLRKRTLYYDITKASQITSAGETGDRTSSDPSVNAYDRKAFKYDRLAPLIIGNFNPDDGLFVGAGFYYQKEGFRKIPFKSRHLAMASIAPRTNSYNFLYRGDFTDVIGKWGMEANVDIKAPNYVNNFFGMGNETTFDRNIDENPSYDLERAIDFYRFRFEEVKLEAYLTRKVGGFGSIKIGPALQRLEIEETNKDRFINEFALTLPYDLFSEYNSYVGLSWDFTFDKRNNSQVPSRGVMIKATGRNMAGTNTGANNFSSYEGSASIYQSLGFPARIMFAARIGGGLNTGDYEFYQAQILDGKTELRGLRKTRFYGDKKFYTNLEMRIKLFSIRTYLFPASLGVLGFHDLGRVWYKDASGLDPSATSGKSNAWHKGWGGGVWFTPFNLAVLSLEAGHSREGTLGYVRLGFMF